MKHVVEAAVRKLGYTDLEEATARAAELVGTFVAWDREFPAGGFADTATVSLTERDFVLLAIFAGAGMKLLHTHKEIE